MDEFALRAKSKQYKLDLDTLSKAKRALAQKIVRHVDSRPRIYRPPTGPFVLLFPSSQGECQLGIEGAAGRNIRTIATHQVSLIFGSGTMRTVSI